jgi:transcriptional regulator GlxA family with amidase domain
MTPPQHYIFALVEEFSHLAFACAVEPLRIANLVSEEPLYRWSFISENGDLLKRHCYARAWWISKPASP